MWNTPHQIFECFSFPTVQTVIVDFHNPLQMADSKDKLLFQLST